MLNLANVFMSDTDIQTLVDLYQILVIKNSIEVIEVHKIF